MIKLCCTQQILKKLKLDPAALKAQQPVETTSALGDWYAKYIINERQHAIVMVNDRTRMCLVTTAKDIQYLPQRLEAAGHLVQAERERGGRRLERARQIVGELRQVRRQSQQTLFPLSQ